MRGNREVIVRGGHRKSALQKWSRGLSLALATVILATPVVALAPAPVLPQDDPLALANRAAPELAAIAFLGSAALPPALGQPAFAVYVAETGHTLEGIFLDEWRATGEDATFGPPISEPFATPDGTYAQVCARGAYWHDTFGQRMSHCCITLPLPVAAFLYGWVPLGTPVTVS